MKLWARLLLAVGGSAVLWIGFTLAAPAPQVQMPTPSPANIKSGQFFKNVTTSTLKDLSVDDFLGAMGVITGDLGFAVLDEYSRTRPNQFLNAGVAEQNMTGLATGLALDGRVVFTYSIGNFPTLRPLVLQFLALAGERLG